MVCSPTATRSKLSGESVQWYIKPSTMANSPNALTRAGGAEAKAPARWARANNASN